VTSRDIIKILRKLGTVGETHGGENIYCCCPLARFTHKKGKDTNPSMSIKVNPTGDSPVMCWSTDCGWVGTLSQLVKYLNHLENGKFEDTVELIEKLEQSGLRTRIDAILNHEPEEEEPEKLYDESMLEPFSRCVPRYALDRGLTIELCKELGLGYDKTHSRLVIPIRNVTGDLVGMMGRAIFPNQIGPPWYAYWNFRKGRYLFGEHLIDTKVDQVILVEGIFDVLRMHLYDYRNVVGLLGSKLTRWQAQKLKDWGLSVTWFMDGDAAGDAGMTMGVARLRGRLDQWVAECPRDKDPDSLKKSEVELAMASKKFVL